MNCFELLSFFSFFLSEIIDDLAHLVDSTDGRIRNETRRVKLVETKSASCGEPSYFLFLRSILALCQGPAQARYLSWSLLGNKSKWICLFMWEITKHQVSPVFLCSVSNSHVSYRQLQSFCRKSTSSWCESQNQLYFLWYWSYRAYCLGYKVIIFTIQNLSSVAAIAALAFVTRKSGA